MRYGGEEPVDRESLKTLLARGSEAVLLRDESSARAAVLASPSEYLDLLVAAFEAGSLEASKLAARLLVALGTRAAPAVDRIGSMLASGDVDVLLRAVLTLGAIGPPALTFAPRIAELAKRGPGFGLAISSWEAYERITGRRLKGGQRGWGGRA